MSAHHRRPPRWRDAGTRVADDAFDALLPDAWRARSTTHFTPAHVARRAAAWLSERPGTWILDVGAGVGKFCVVAAAAFPGATFIGVERRLHLVRVATSIALDLGVPNARFVHGDAVELDWAIFDGFYLFNPFAEHLRDNRLILDQSVELDPAYYLFYVGFVRDQLIRAQYGTRVVTYHGFGAAMPPGYALVRSEFIGTGPLELWVKRRTALPRSGWSRDLDAPECA